MHMEYMVHRNRLWNYSLRRLINPMLRSCYTLFCSLILESIKSQLFPPTSGVKGIQLVLWVRQSVCLCVCVTVCAIPTEPFDIRIQTLVWLTILTSSRYYSKGQGREITWHMLRCNIIIMSHDIIVCLKFIQARILTKRERHGRAVNVQAFSFF